MLFVYILQQMHAVTWTPWWTYDLWESWNAWDMIILECMRLAWDLIILNVWDWGSLKDMKVENPEIYVTWKPSNVWNLESRKCTRLENPKIHEKWKLWNDQTCMRFDNQPMYETCNPCHVCALTVVKGLLPSWLVLRNDAIWWHLAWLAVMCMRWPSSDTLHPLVHMLVMMRLDAHPTDHFNTFNTNNSHHSVSYQWIFLLGPTVLINQAEYISRSVTSLWYNTQRLDRPIILTQISVDC